MPSRAKSVPAREMPSEDVGGLLGRGLTAVVAGVQRGRIFEYDFA